MTLQSFWLLVPLVVLIPVAFVGFWCLVTFLVAQLGGWNALAKRYRAAQKPAHAEWFPIETGSMGASEYKGCLIIGVAPEGLYFSVLFLFRVGHPPLLVPWNAFRRIKTEKVFWRTAYEATAALSEARYDDVTITLYNKRIADAIQQHISASIAPV